MPNKHHTSKSKLSVWTHDELKKKAAEVLKKKGSTLTDEITKLLTKIIDMEELNLNQTIQNAVNWLGENQKENGMWVGPIETNCCMEAQWVLAMHFIGNTSDHKYKGVIKHILNRQRPDGSWEVYYDSPQGDINTTVECYAALRSSGISPDEEPMVKARTWILSNGGLSQIRVFTKYWLALIGQWPWEHTPVMPPEIIFLPTWAPFNIYKFACWARATLVPLAVLSARRPVKSLPEGINIDELFPEGREKFDYSLKAQDSNTFSWQNLFLKIDKLLHTYNCKMFLKPGREKAIQKCLDWIIDHQDEDGAWGGIQPPWIYSIMALFNEGMSVDDPILFKAVDAFNHHWSIEKDDAIMLQASESPVWDTLLSIQAVLDSGYNQNDLPFLKDAIEWTLSKENQSYGDWFKKVKGIKPSGWAFERANKFYPDIDDTAVAIIAYYKARMLGDENEPLTYKMDAAIGRAAQWIFGLQCENGGWGAFDKDNTSTHVLKIPFCDFGEVLDPPSADVTAHVVEALSYLGYTKENESLAKALEYIKSEQEDDGSWFGRWGVNYIYGTGAVLPALREAGIDMTQDWVIKAASWLCSKQNEDGGWGETCGSYMDPSLAGIGPSTASQTGWALIALLAMENEKYAQNIIDGCKYLTKTQNSEGTWDELHYTGTGFPGYGLGAKVELRQGAALPQGKELARGFMLRYDMYRHYFPLTALGRAKKYFGK